MKSLAFFAALLLAVYADPSKTIVENAIATPSLSSLVKLLTSPGYEPILKALSGPGNFTVFAPDNYAFNLAKVDPKQVDFVTQVLLYHVLPFHVASKDLHPAQYVNTLMSDPRYVNIGKDKGQYVGVLKLSSGVVEVVFGLGQRGAGRVVIADVECSNGIVHVVDRVLTFAGNTSSIAKALRLNTLVEAIVKADLLSTIENTPGLTIFAPTDAAFAAIGGISKLTKEQLQKVLTYHVVPAEAFSSDLKDGQTLPTVQGQTLTVKFNSGRVYISGAMVSIPNVITKNAAIHVIDKVLLPK